jgi:hypothetical protein
LKLLIAPLWASNRAKPWRRVVADTLTRYMVTNMSYNQSQSAMPGDLEVYKSFDSNGTVDDLGDGAHLMWVGEKRTEKVVLEFHGEWQEVI